MSYARWISAVACVGMVVLMVCVAGQAEPDAQAPTTKTAPKPAVKTGTTQHTFSETITEKVRGKYLLFLPENTGKPGVKLPLILFLHGSGERGNNVADVGKIGLPKAAKSQPGFPFIVLSPQCPAKKWWTDPDVTRMVMAMLDDICKTYPVDLDRVYLTGLSMGGFGAFALAEQYPERFAALVPLCGGGNPYLAKRLKNIPTRIYHGAKDRSVPLMLSKQMASAIKQFKGDVELKVYPKLGHNIWGVTYDNPKLYEWLLTHRRKSKRKSK